MISIVMIVYEVAPYLPRAIESVLAQDYKDIELILVSNLGGRDNCADICRDYAAKDSRIKLVEIPVNGIADARNHGIEHVTGDYLGFVDGDDYIEPDMFSSMLRNIEKYQADIAICGRFYEYQNKTLMDEAKEPTVYTADEALAVVLSNKGFYLHCWDKLYSRKIYEGLHFRTDVFVEDRIVVNKLLGKADKIVYDPTPKYHFRERSGSQSKIAGMIANNVIANSILQDYILEKHPSIANECQSYMLYEYITAVQNELVASGCDRQNVKKYQEKVRQTYNKSNPLIGRTMKIKTMLALYFPFVLKMYTKNMQKKVSNELTRFP